MNIPLVHPLHRQAKCPCLVFDPLPGVLCRGTDLRGGWSAATGGLQHRARLQTLRAPRRPTAFNPCAKPAVSGHSINSSWMTCHCHPRGHQGTAASSHSVSHRAAETATPQRRRGREHTHRDQCSGAVSANAERGAVSANAEESSPQRGLSCRVRCLRLAAGCFCQEVSVLPQINICNRVIDRRQLLFETDGCDPGFNRRLVVALHPIEFRAFNGPCFISCHAWPVLSARAKKAIPAFLVLPPASEHLAQNHIQRTGRSAWPPGASEPRPVPCS